MRPFNTAVQLGQLASMPAAGANTGCLFRVGSHVYFDTGTAVVQVDQQSLAAILSSTVPSTPTDGTTLALFEQNRARPTLAQLDLGGFPFGVQTSFFENAPSICRARGGNTTTFDTFGFAAPTTVGTLGGIAASGGYKTRTMSFATATTAGSSAEIRIATPLWMINVTPVGGFYFATRVSPFASANSGGRCFIGMSATSTAFGNVNPSTLFNLVGLGADAGDTNYSVMANDASGVATKTAVPTSVTGVFNAGNAGGDYLDFRMYSPAGYGSSVVYWWLYNFISSGTQNTPTNFASGVITTNIPIGILLCPHLWVNNGANASAVSAQFSDLYLESNS